jgi:hypothetical protein
MMLQLIGPYIAFQDGVKIDAFQLHCLTGFKQAHQWSYLSKEANRP